jgi:hypothetical protein
MNRKHVLLAVAAVLAAGTWWFARSAWRAPEVQTPSAGVAWESPSDPPNPGPNPAGHDSQGRVGSETPPGPGHAGQSLRPPEPNRRFTDFTPEQRVEFARRGHGPGG